MRFYPVILNLLLLPFSALAQTNISGVINSYHKVSEVITADACVRVDNTTGLTRGDLVLIIQMKGATVPTANTSSFGSITSLNNAGNYEINTICNVEDDLVYMFRQLAQSYTHTDMVQLVKIPTYSSAIVTGTLLAAPWDSATGKGGVLALNVLNDLVLNASLDASGAGFKGGAYMTSSSSCANFLPASNWVYNATILSPQDGAYKGEGVANLAVTYSGGKGAAANGGGGGNNHNNGGGGGANLVAGGLGGGNSSAAGCTVSNPGRGGYALNSNSGSKIFLGGGGGAGHANSGFFSSGGGAGGGIIIFHANNLISNGQKIMANGVAGGNTIGDGASGGGAGGTIIMDVNNFVDAVNTEAIGGKGGDENDDATSQRCYGEGGGGSGGVIYFKNTTPAGTIDVAGGVKGSRLNSLNCGTINAGANGTTGSTIPNYSYIQSSVLSTYCGIALDVQLKKFTVKLHDNNAMIEWQVASAEELEEFIVERRKDTEQWKIIYSTAPSSIQSYSYTDKNLSAGSYHYRLRLVEKNAAEKYSQVRSISIGNENLALYPNPAFEFITIMYQFKAGTKLKMLNALGGVVLQHVFHRDETFFKLNISSFRRGIYYVVVGDENIRFSIQ